ncbi:type II secretion system protein GspG [Sulfurimonas sp. CS5]|jgi:hypothetical protein|uniref:type II secretion system protein GspG n=1 Tax=Sulfurimonas sp. CS5 TaxID=3391145 RepID=UPI0039EAE2C7
MSNNQEKLGTFPFIIGGASFIPGIGIMFGIISITWGLITKKLGGKKLAIIGSSGIAFSIILYGTLFYFTNIQRGGLYDELREKLAVTTITSLVQAIEFYKTQNGKYPKSLEALQIALPKDSMVFVNDPTGVPLTDKPRYFHYELKDESHYYLLGVGIDGNPYTNDDILPDIKVDNNSSVGLIIHSNSIKVL